MDLPNEKIAREKANNLIHLRQHEAFLKSHTVRDEYGKSLLQVAIICQNRSVFDYLLSINYPLEITNREGETALYTAFTDYIRDQQSLDIIYFVNRLIERGADVSVLFKPQFLLYAVEDERFLHIAKILIKNGVDVNVRDPIDGRTPLHLILKTGQSFEIAAMLLVYGADVFAQDSKGFFPFDVSAGVGGNGEIQEVLALYTFDKYTEYKMTASSLINLALYHPSLFLRIYKNIVDINWDDDLKFFCEGEFVLLNIRAECFNVLIENFSEVLHHILLTAYIYISPDKKTINDIAKNFYAMCNNSILEQDLVYFFSHNVSFISLGPSLDHNLFRSPVDMSEITKALYCFMLSYGLPVTEEELQRVYQIFGYCELFKIMLNMDIDETELTEGRDSEYDAVPMLCYDFNVDFQTLCDDENCINVDELLYYYNDSVVKDHCLRSEDEKVVNRVRSMPEVSLLTELARNAFRGYFIEEFEITTPKRFYTLLKALPISPVHEKIISLETKLY